MKPHGSGGRWERAFRLARLAFEIGVGVAVASLVAVAVNGDTAATAENFALLPVAVGAGYGAVVALEALAARFWKRLTRGAAGQR